MSQLEGILVFKAPLVQQLNSDQVRLPTNHVGVRRVRPSNRMVWNAFRSSPDDKQDQQAPIVYKVTDSDGNERRMTTQEKKERKLMLKRAQAEARKEQKQKRKLATLSPPQASSTDVSFTQPSNSGNQPLPTGVTRQDDELVQRQKREYHQLQVSSKVMAEELAELRGERSGVPPVFLSPPMARQAMCLGVLPVATTAQEQDSMLSRRQSSGVAALDDDLARQWAQSLKLNMKAAEEVRSRESMRPMAYQLVPEVWTRMRPTFDGDGEGDRASENPNTTLTGAVAEPVDSDCSATWSFVAVRHCVQPLDSDLSIVYEFLHRNTKLHVACGAKFGCDFLLYDGPREERHAFAGLRVYSATRNQEDHLPLPSAYDLAGFVRCLNTAGKLALVVAVHRSGDGLRLAFVDLALEKILSASTHAKRSKKARRDAGKNLAKTSV